MATNRFDKIIFGLLIGGFFPLLLGLLSMIFWFYTSKQESLALIYLIGGILPGLIIDIKYLNTWIKNRYRLSVWFVVSIYTLYNIFLLGMFMGFPVFNLFPGIIAGYYYGKKLHFLKVPSENYALITKRVSLFTGMIMMLICIFSGFIALIGNGVGPDLQQMLGLPFEPSKSLILVTAIIGGIFLVVAQYLLTAIMIKKFSNK